MNEWMETSDEKTFLFWVHDYIYFHLFVDAKWYILWCWLRWRKYLAIAQSECYETISTQPNMTSFIHRNVIFHMFFDRLYRKTKIWAERGCRSLLTFESRATFHFHHEKYLNSPFTGKLLRNTYNNEIEWGPLNSGFKGKSFFVSILFSFAKKSTEQLGNYITWWLWMSSIFPLEHYRANTTYDSEILSIRNENYIEFTCVIAWVLKCLNIEW